MPGMCVRLCLLKSQFLLNTCRINIKLTYQPLQMLWIKTAQQKKANLCYSSIKRDQVGISDKPLSRIRIIPGRDFYRILLASRLRQCLEMEFRCEHLLDEKNSYLTAVSTVIGLDVSMRQKMGLQIASLIERLATCWTFVR